MSDIHSMSDIEENLHHLKARIAHACEAAGRSAKDITLIGVSKTKPVADVEEAARLGLRQFGENYLDEAVQKITATKELALTWHYIGRVQSNKTRLLANHFDWVHTVDRLKILQRLSQQLPQGKLLNVLLQVNIDEDPAKGGVMANEIGSLLKQAETFDNLRLRGLMTILAQDHDPRASYQSMAQLAATLHESLSPARQAAWNVLSMGMTADLDEAIAAGATHIRIGTALFGAR